MMQIKYIYTDNKPIQQNQENKFSKILAEQDAIMVIAMGITRTGMLKIASDEKFSKAILVDFLNAALFELKKEIHEHRS